MKTLKESSSHFYEIVANKLATWLEAIFDLLPNFLVAVLILLVFVGLGKAFRSVVKRFLRNTSDSEALNNLILKVVYLSVILTGAFIALSVLKLDKAVTSLLAGAGIIGLALGFAFQDIAANFMSGIIMTFRKPIRIGDLIETNDIFGTVKNINLRSSELMTPQGQLMIVPNRKIFESPIKNYTITGMRRVDLGCGVSYGEDLQRVKDITLAAIESIEARDKNKDVKLFFTEFGDSSINFVVAYWIDNSTAQGDFLEAQHQGVLAIKKAYDAHDITIPFPIRTLDFGIKGGEKLSEMLLKQD